MLHDRQERFSVRSCVQRLASVTSVRIAPEIWISLALVQERREMCLKFGSKKVRIGRARSECGSEAGSKRARGVWPMISGELVSTSTRDRKPAQGRNRLDDR